MKYEIEDLSLVEKQITVLVSEQEVDIAIETTVSQKRQVFNKNGFRKDIASSNLIFKEHKKEILSQAAQQIFMVKVQEVQDLYKINPINRLQIQSEAPLEKGKDFRFCFVAEVIPDLEIPDLEAQEVEIKKVVVTEKDIDRIIDSLREQLSTLEEINDDRLAADGDVAMFDFESQGEFKKLKGMSGTCHKLELGTRQTNEDFENIIKTLKPGESKTGTVTYPSDFPNPILAGKSVKTSITLRTLHRKILPEIDEELAKEATKTGSVAEMRATVHQRHFQRLTYLHKQDAISRLMDSLVQKTNMPLSPTYVARNLEDMVDRYTVSMQQQGMTMAEISKQMDEKRKQFLPEAESATKRQLILLAIAKKERLKLEPQEVEREITRHAEIAETDIRQFILDAQASGFIRNMKDDMMMRKVMDLLFEKAGKKII